MASDDLRRSGSDQATGGGPARAGGGEKGIFDHLAEYLLQQPLPGAEASAPPPAPDAPTAPTQPQATGQPLQASAPPRPSESELSSQELVFAETAEQLVVEKQVLVSEVPGKLVEEHVQEINDSGRDTEVEVERITPAEAEQIAKAAPPPAVDQREPVPRPSAALPPRAASVQPAPRMGQKAPSNARPSLAWWVWYALILGAGLLIAFALGQLIGSPGG